MDPGRHTDLALASTTAPGLTPALLAGEVPIGSPEPGHVRCAADLSLYPTDTPSDVPGYFVLGVEPAAGAEVAHTISIPSGHPPMTVAGRTFITRVGVPWRAYICPSTMLFRVQASVDAAAGSCVATVTVHVRHADGTETLLADATTPELTTVPTRYAVDYTISEQVQTTEADRIIWRFGAVRTAGTAARVVTVYYLGARRYSFLGTTSHGAGRAP